MKIEQPQCDRVVDPLAERNTACDVQSTPIVPPDCPHGESQLSPDVFFDELLKSFSIELNTPEAIQSRTSAFETRLATLQTLHQRLESLVSAVSTYRDTPGLLAEDLDTIISALEGTLDGGNPNLWPDRAARGCLLHDSIKCLESSICVFEVLDVPITLEPFHTVLEKLKQILELEGQFSPELPDEQHLLEQTLADDDLWNMAQQSRVVTAWLSLQPDSCVVPENPENDDTVTLRNVVFEIKQNKKIIRRIEEKYKNAKAEFGNAQQDDRWTAAMVLFRARGGAVDLQNLLKDQSTDNLRKISQQIRNSLSTLDVKVTNVQGMKSHWRLELASP